MKKSIELLVLEAKERLITDKYSANELHIYFELCTVNHNTITVLFLLQQTPNIPLTDQMITPSPDVTEIDLIPSADEFLVIACDGVWNSMTSQEVVEFIQDRLHPPTINNSSSENTSNSHSNSGADVSKNGNDLGEVGKLDSSDQLTKICHEVR